MTQITVHYLNANDNTPQTIMISKTAKFVKAVVDPGFSNRVLVMHEIETRGDYVEWDYQITNGSEILPDTYERLDTVVNKAGVVLHILRKIPVETKNEDWKFDPNLKPEPESKVEIGIEGVETNSTEKKLPEPTTETTFHFEASHNGGYESRVKLSGECKFDGIFLLLERFSESSPGEQGAFVKKLITDFEARQVGGGYSLEMFTAEKWVEVKAKRDADWAEFQRRSEGGYAVG